MSECDFEAIRPSHGLCYGAPAIGAHPRHTGSSGSHSGEGALLYPEWLHNICHRGNEEGGMCKRGASLLTAVIAVLGLMVCWPAATQTNNRPTAKVDGAFIKQNE